MIARPRTDAAWTLAGASFAFAWSFVVHQFFINPVCAYEAQQPVFFTTTEFLADHLGVPGGLATYLGLLLSQALSHRLAGSLVLSAVMVLVFVATNLLLSRLRGRASPALSLLPLLPLLAMHGSYYHPMKTDVVVLFVLLGARGYAALGTWSRGLRFVGWLVLFVLVFYSTGVAGALLFAAFSASFELFQPRNHCKQWKKGALEAMVRVVLGASLLFLAHSLLIGPSHPSELESFLARSSGSRIALVALATVIALAPLLSLVSLIRGRDEKPRASLRRTILRAAAAGLLFVGVGAASIGLLHSETVRRQFLYDRWAQEGKWSDILRDLQDHSSEDNPPVGYDAFYGLRAMYHTDKLLKMLVYSHSETPMRYLAFPPSENGETSIANGDLYFEMGATNHAIRFATEALAVYGYAPRLLKRLAICFAAQGKIEIARSMTTLLRSSLVARTWAGEFGPLLDNPQALAQDPDIRRLRQLAPKSEFMFQLTSLSYEFRHIWLGSGSFNRMAMEYFLAAAPQMMEEYLGFMVLAGECFGGNALSCDKCKTEFGRTFWYNHFVHSPYLFGLYRSPSSRSQALP